MRPSKDKTYMEIAKIISQRTTCARRAVGAVATDEHGYILGTGYNGVPSTFLHCNEGHQCSGASSLSGTNLEGCAAIHCEQNLLLHCSDLRRIHSIFITTSPCSSCIKLILSTTAQRIVFLEYYPGHENSKELWERAGRIWECYQE